MAFPKNYTGTASVKVTSAVKTIDEFTTEDVSGGFDSFIACASGGSNSSFSVIYLESVRKNGVYNFTYDKSTSGRLTYVRNGSALDVFGTVKVTTTYEGDRQELQFSGTFVKDEREYKIEGTGYLKYEWIF